MNALLLLVAAAHATLTPNLAAKIAHLDPDTYARLLKLAASIDAPAVGQLFMTELMFTAKDFAGVRENLLKLTGELQARCRAGKLKLDLDLESHFLNRTVQAGCEG